MTFLILIGLGVGALLLLKNQDNGVAENIPAPSGEALTPSPDMSDGNDVQSYVRQGPAMLAFGKATLGSQPSPALVNLTPDVVAPGSVIPPMRSDRRRFQVAGFADPQTLLKQSTPTTPTRVGVAMDSGVREVAAGLPVGPSDSVKPHAPLTGLIPPNQTDSLFSGGMISIPTSCWPPTIPPDIKGSPFTAIPSASGSPSPSASIPPNIMSPTMPPPPVAAPPPSPPIVAPAGLLGSPLLPGVVPITLATVAPVSPPAPITVKPPVTYAPPRTGIRLSEP